MCSSEGGDQVPVAVNAARGALATAVERAAAGGFRELCHDDLSRLVGDLRAAQAQVESVLLSAVREVDTRGSFVVDGALTPAAWLRAHTRLQPRTAAAAVRTARALHSGELPLTAAALARGEIAPEQAREIASIVERVPAGTVQHIESDIVEVAKVADVRAVASVMRALEHAIDPDKADEDALRRFDRRGLAASSTLDGMVAGRFVADELNGAVILEALDAAGPPVAGDTRSSAQRRLDALADVCRRFLASPDAPMSGGGHAHLIVTIDSDTLDPDPASDVDADENPGAGKPSDDGPDGLRSADDVGGLHSDDAVDPDVDLDDVRPDEDVDSHDEAPSAPRGDAAGSPGATLSWVGRIAGSTARRAACDADVTVVAISPDGSASLIGRERRFFTAAQRAAMVARDGDRCAWPYCDRPVAWADGHHLQWWSHGGATTVDNGVLPCTGHHTMLHEGGWSLRRQPEGRYLARHRDGRVIGPEPHKPGHNRPPPRGPG